MAKNDFQYAGWNFYTLQCGMCLESWQWIHQVVAPCNVIRGSGWHAIEFAQTSAILEFYISFPFPHITAVDTSFCTTTTTLWSFIQIGPPSAEKNDVMSIFKMADLSIIWVLLEIYLAFQQWKYCENPLRIDKVIVMSLVYYFFGTQCIMESLWEIHSHNCMMHTDMKFGRLFDLVKYLEHT